ncbi:hypothetical protein HPP92_022395 [Vanilla planifolia]|uniref:Dof zinc finger protein n=1 Tax=Vanilla planifolia TaxID=51239 RepID=A0A835Q0H7_VANPL|nr:hypothetical protein HPP92_022395 [Vanilla planifolia]
MDSTQWLQQGTGFVDETESSTRQRRTRPLKQLPLSCPRCSSTNTKFCYYNNYSLSQPRHLCKSCKRYWTQGGTLRNVPVGGSSRKKKINSSSSLPSSTRRTLASSLVPQMPNPSGGFALSPFSTGITPFVYGSSMFKLPVDVAFENKVMGNGGNVNREGEDPTLFWKGAVGDGDEGGEWWERMKRFGFLS